MGSSRCVAKCEQSTCFQEEIWPKLWLKERQTLARECLLLLLCGVWGHEGKRERILGSGINKNKCRTKSSSFKATKLHYTSSDKILNLLREAFFLTPVWLPSRVYWRLAAKTSRVWPISLRWVRMWTPQGRRLQALPLLPKDIPAENVFLNWQVPTLVHFIPMAYEFPLIWVHNANLFIKTQNQNYWYNRKNYLSKCCISLLN